MKNGHSLLLNDNWDPYQNGHFCSSLNCREVVVISVAQDSHLFSVFSSIGQTGYLEGTEINTGYFIVLTFLFPQWIVLKVIDQFRAEQAHKECALGDSGTKSCNISSLQ